MLKSTKIALSVLVAAATALSAHAVPITGSINFEGGTVQLNGPVTTATAITSFGGSTIVNNNAGVQPTGSFTGTGGTSVTFAPGGFQFSPILNPNPVNPLWTFNFGGLTYSFTMNSVVSSVGVGPALNLAGSGILNITGTGSPYSATAGNWTFSTTGAGDSTFTFGFVAGNSAVPEAGTTAILLGMGLIGLAAFAQFRKQSVA